MAAPGGCRQAKWFTRLVASFHNSQASRATANIHLTMRLLFIALLVASALLASVNAVVTTVDAKAIKVAADHLLFNLPDVPARRQLRTNEMLDHEERVMVGATLPDILKRGAQKVTDSVRVRYWVQTNTKTPDGIFTKLKLDGGLEKALKNKNLNLNTWFTYVDLYNKKFPNKKISVIGMFTNKYGDVAVARTLELAKNAKSTQKMARRLSRDQLETWKLEGKTIQDIFKLLNLGTAKNDLFKRYELSTWMIYIKKITGKNPRATAVSELESHYGAATLAKMLLTAKPPIRNLRLLSSRLENTMLRQWLSKKLSADDVFKLLKLDAGGVQGAFSNPVFQTWVGYLGMLSESTRGQQTMMVKAFTASYGNEAVARMLDAAKRVPNTKKQATELQIAQFSQWVHQWRTPTMVAKMLPTKTDAGIVRVYTVYYKMIKAGTIPSS
ncbi:hypothetical protein KRP22_013760 [Phytophthora ramorum]|nr:RxLR effector protein [Phytophthora ramorum]